MKPLRFVVIGLGGFGLVHLQAVKWLEEQGTGKLTGIVALEIDRQRHPDLVESYTRDGVRFYEDIDDFFENGLDTADVLTVPIGIHQHVPVSIRAMKAGLDVYCEKPVSATVQEADELILAEKETGRKIAIGYQHIYSHSIQELKKRISSGLLGRPKSIKLMCGWPRSLQYFGRNEWTGKLRLNGHWILDSIANNACSHYVLNTLYLASENPVFAAKVATLDAELYRANKIESTDTVQMKFKTADDVEGYIILTHTNWYENGPVLHIPCENGVAYWQGDNGMTFIKYNDGTTEEFNNLTNPKWRFNGFNDLVQAIRYDRPTICTPQLARTQTMVINAMHESCPEIGTIPEHYIREVEDWEIFPPDTKGHFRRVVNMDEYMHIAFQEEKFLSELNILWASQTKHSPVDLSNYNEFTGDSVVKLLS